MEDFYLALFNEINKRLDLRSISEKYDKDIDKYTINFNLQNTPENFLSGKSKIESLVKEVLSGFGLKYEFNKEAPKQMFFNNFYNKYVVSVMNKCRVPSSKI